MTIQERLERIRAAALQAVAEVDETYRMLGLAVPSDAGNDKPAKRKRTKAKPPTVDAAGRVHDEAVEP